jgi:hypothetical protein
MTKSTASGDLVILGLGVRGFDNLCNIKQGTTAIIKGTEHNFNLFIVGLSN